ncbi:hypothetical protein FIM12_02030 [SAR202 cluster bacterium AD-804-J14_MRT_500m]|nr:hypothetical protein [SAR202 cluster bacterium AD-804-J14_MRT_500m]
MELLFLLVLPAALWAQSWYFLGLYNNPRTLGVISATVALALGGLVVFGGETTHTAISGLILVWAVYAAIVAAVALWGFDERTLGFYALFLSLISLLYVAYYFLGSVVEGGVAGVESYVMGIAALLLTVIAALVFFYLGAPFARMRQSIGWFELVLSVIIAVLGGLVLLGLSLD